MDIVIVEDMRSPFKRQRTTISTRAMCLFSTMSITTTLRSVHCFSGLQVRSCLSINSRLISLMVRNKVSSITLLNIFLLKQAAWKLHEIHWVTLTNPTSQRGNKSHFFQFFLSQFLHKSEPRVEIISSNFMLLIDQLIHWIFFLQCNNCICYDYRAAQKYLEE